MSYISNRLAYRLNEVKKALDKKENQFYDTTDD